MLLSPTEKREKKFVQIFFPGGFSVTAELAATDEERQIGLMFRERIDPEEGMLFVFQDESYHAFWMKNMRVSLDILWLDREKRIVHIEREVPPCKKEPCPSLAPGLPARFVLELKAGSVESYRLKLYDTVDFILPSELRRFTAGEYPHKPDVPALPPRFEKRSFFREAL